MLSSDRIFKIMTEQGMTQKTFSEKTGISQSAISEGTPSYELLVEFEQMGQNQRNRLMRYMAALKK